MIEARPCRGWTLQFGKARGALKQGWQSSQQMSRSLAELSVHTHSGESVRRAVQAPQSSPVARSGTGQEVQRLALKASPVSLRVAHGTQIHDPPVASFPAQISTCGAASSPEVCRGCRLRLSQALSRTVHTRLIASFPTRVDPNCSHLGTMSHGDVLRCGSDELHGNTGQSGGMSDSKSPNAGHSRRRPHQLLNPIISSLLFPGLAGMKRMAAFVGVNDKICASRACTRAICGDICRSGRLPLR